MCSDESNAITVEVLALSLSDSYNYGHFHKTQSFSTPTDTKGAIESVRMNGVSALGVLNLETV